MYIKTTIFYDKITFLIENDSMFSYSLLDNSISGFPDDKIELMGDNKYYTHSELVNLE